MSTHDDQAIERILSRGVATQAQVAEAAAIRAKMLEMGLKPRSLSEILYEKGYLELEQLEALRREERRWQGQEQIAGYRLLELLGEGAMGAVYKARQLSLDRDVAIKVLSPELAKDEAFVKRFQTEAKAVARLNHTNLISGIDVGDADGIKYLVMEYADGNTVASLLRRGGALDEERALVIALQTARALEHAHKAGLVHRDVKPDNIIITREGVAKLCDLGLARLEGATESVGRMGTPAYISPEQARGDTDVDARTDLYSLGATLFHMLTGRPPYEAAQAAAVLAKHLTEPVPSLASAGADAAPRTEDIVRRLLAKSPAERYTSATELIPDLDAAVRELQLARGLTPAAASFAAAPVATAATAVKPAVARPAAAPVAPAAPPAPGGGAPVPRRRR